MDHRKAADRPGGSRPFQRRLARRDPRVAKLLECVALERGVPVEMLIARSRCRAHIAVARRLAMYLMHVTLGRPILSVAKLFGRHVSSVMRGCYAIEDGREDEAFDRLVSGLEATVRAANENRTAAGERRHAG
jgi:chromosomal replication initiation ATPase DnaA